GKLDLAVASAISLNFPNCSVLLNTTPPGASAPTFAPVVKFIAASTPFSIAIGDFNGDGRKDLAVPGTDFANVAVRLNTGVELESNLVITSINGGVAPTVGNSFSVTIESVDTHANPINVTNDTHVALTLKTGTGTLGGTTTGTITAGTSSVTIS